MQSENKINAKAGKLTFTDAKAETDMTKLKWTPKRTGLV
jgi:hypothetical protein